MEIKTCLSNAISNYLRTSQEERAEEKSKQALRSLYDILITLKKVYASKLRQTSFPRQLTHTRLLFKEPIQALIVPLLI